MAKPDIVRCAPVRTPIGIYGGALKDTRATDPGAAVIREALQRSGPAADTVVMGLVIQADARTNPARQAAVGGGQEIALALEML